MGQVNDIMIAKWKSMTDKDKEEICRSSLMKIKNDSE